MANFDESKHPRDDDGKFTDGNASQWTTSKRDYSNVQGGEAQRVFDEAKQLGIDTKGIDNLDVIKAKIEIEKQRKKNSESNRIINATAKKIGQEICSLDYEVGVIIGKDGKVLQKVDGTHNIVEVDPNLLKGAAFTHNHPEGSCFSAQDMISFLQADVYQMRATTPSGKTFILTRDKDFVKPSLAMDYKKAGSFRSEGEGRVQELTDQYISSGYSLADAAYNAKSDYREEWLEKHAKEYNVTFEVEWDAE